MAAQDDPRQAASFLALMSSVLQNERALTRISDGTYGTCESCGNAIGKLRLQAFPRATLCVACKHLQERH